MVHDFKFIFKKKIFTFVMVLNTSCILLFMTVRHNKAVSTHYETDYVYRHKRESFSVANWLQLLSNDQWGPEFEYIFYKQWYIFYKYRNIVVGAFPRGVVGPWNYFIEVKLQSNLYDEIELIHLKLMSENTVKRFIASTVKTPS